LKSATILLHRMKKGHNSPRLSYADAGVSIDAGNALVERIKPLAKATARKGSMSSIGGFGALFDVKKAGFKDPVLVSTTDGVGTKLKIAIAAGRHEHIGIDLVAMCVNDLIVQGAEPLFFLDYFATSSLNVAIAETVIAGIAKGCKDAGCALVGGETAEMPGLYEEGEYDLAGFAVGAVERKAILPQKNIKAGDVLLGLASSGVHSNGYSLVRKIMQVRGYSYEDKAPFARGKTYADALLAPTRIYVKSCLAAIRTGKVKALAHITGGGLLENIPRVLPDSLAAEIELKSWKRPAVFDWLEEEGGVAKREMLRTFNCGIGMVLAVSAKDAKKVAELLKKQGETVFTIGELVKRKRDAVIIT